MEVSKLNRFLGYLIDTAVAYAIIFVFGIIAGATEMASLAFVGFALFVAYMLLRDALFSGQSIGKKVMKYKAVKEDGSTLAGDFGASATRSISLFIPIIGLIDAIYVVTDKPRFGDNWTKTKVINT